MEQRHDDPRLNALIESLTALRARAIALEQSNQAAVAQVVPAYRNSARNLLHYLALRQVDLRDDQEDLADLGLSSLGRSEAHTLHTIEAVLRALHTLAGKQIPFRPQAPVSYADGNGLLEAHTQQLFGTAAGKRDVRIMVTMPSAAATDAALARHLVASGMDVMRINCAHDDPDTWAGMIDNLNRARRELGRECKVYADLAGPKLRTGAIAPGPHVLKLRPTRNSRGEVTAAARAIFITDQQPASASGVTNDNDDIAVVPVTADLIAPANRGDVIALTDARGKARKLNVTATRDDALIVESDKTVYVETGGKLTLRRKEIVVAEGAIGDLPAVTALIVLTVNDRLVLTNDAAPGQAAVHDAKGRLVTPAHISCEMEGAFHQVKPGEAVWLDDGKIGGRVLDNDGRRMTVQITHAAEGGSKLQPEKGINFPDSALDLPALTTKDLDDLAFMAGRADIIGMSFVREPQDVLALAAHLDALDAGHVGTVLKIENRRAFENLPHLLLACMRHPPVGVMVARGDLAVEVGYERLAEVQEQILWLCEAAHVPVIWATQVLESLAKRGAPSRAEVSDAVMSGRAECVMLNKGPYIVEAARFLNGVLERMSAHQSKKRARFRPLSVSKAVTT